jgi:hypothetical protein
MIRMNTLLKNPCARTIVGPDRNPANPSQRILVAEDGVVIRQLNAGLGEEAVC